MDVTVRDVEECLASLETTEAPTEGVDGVEVGSPDATVDGIAVAWMPYERTIERAADRDCDLLVTHEPLFYHTGATPDPGSEREVVAQRMAAKRAFVESRGVTVLRCHDAWDLHPGEGVTDSWGARLGLDSAGEATVKEAYVRVYDVPERSARRGSRADRRARGRPRRVGDRTAGAA